MLAVGAYAIHTRVPKIEDGGVPALNVPTGSDRPHEDHVVHETGPKDAAPIAMASIDAAKAEVIAKRPVDAAVTTVELPVDAAPSIDPVTVQVKVLGNSTYRIGNGEWKPAPDGRISVSFEGKPVDIMVRNDCCIDVPVHIDGTKPQLFPDQDFKLAQITPTCTTPGVSANVGTRKGVEIGKAVPITFEKYAPSSEKDVIVEFVEQNGKSTSRTVTVKAGQSQEVKCDLR